MNKKPTKRANEPPIKYKTIKLNGQRIRIASCRLDPKGKSQTPILVFNGIGASAEMLEPFFLAIKHPVLSIDMPGVGGTSLRLKPQRMGDLATLAADVLTELSIDKVYAMGISWGGGLAQQFAYQHEKRCSKLILAATSTGNLMAPPKLSVLLRMATPLRYYSAGFFKRNAGSIYGGDFRKNKSLTSKHSKAMAPPSMSGYMYQLFAAAGWTSLFWLHKLKQKTLIMAGNDDPIIRPCNSKILASRIPNSTLKTFNCGHLFILTRLKESVQAITDFLADIDVSKLVKNSKQATAKPK